MRLLFSTIDYHWCKRYRRSSICCCHRSLRPVVSAEFLRHSRVHGRVFPGTNHRIAGDHVIIFTSCGRCGAITASNVEPRMEKFLFNPIGTIQLGFDLPASGHDLVPLCCFCLPAPRGARLGAVRSAATSRFLSPNLFWHRNVHILPRTKCRGRSDWIVRRGQKYLGRGAGTLSVTRVHS